MQEYKYRWINTKSRKNFESRVEGGEGGRNGKIFASMEGRWKVTKNNSKKVNLHNVSGAVGAICLHLKVFSIISSLSLPSTYLKISEIVCPAVPKNLTPSISNAAGFVVVVNVVPVNALAVGNMAGCIFC